jgi:hypothetical protein
VNDDWLTTDCRRCDAARRSAISEGDVIGRLSMRMIVCPDCGNKRCPRATDHRLGCSGSNDPGQVGSDYGVPL